MGPAGPQGDPAAAGKITGQLDRCGAATNFAGAVIYIPGRAFNVISGPDGAFQIDNVPPGTYQLRVNFGGTDTAAPMPVTVADTTVSAGLISLLDTSADPNNCGACGNVCPQSSVCSNGSCQAAPKLPNGSACASADACQSGFCAQGITGMVCASSACSGGCQIADANGNCTTAQYGSDPKDACGNSACNGAGSCLNISSDFNNCGALGLSCNLTSTNQCTNGVCKCGNNAACGGTTPVCANGSCVQCLTSAQCGGATPVCDPTSRSCVQCTGNSQCGSGVCNTTTNQCVQCNDNSQCGGPTPACNTTTHTCVACVSNFECTSASAPFCNTATNTCTGCTNNAQCASRSPAMPACNVATQTCVQCTSSAQCFGATPVCDVTTNTCRAGD